MHLSSQVRPLAVAEAPPLDLSGPEAALGRSQSQDDLASLAPMHGMALTFQREDAPLTQGDVIPPGWHAAYFLPRAPLDGLGPAGTPLQHGVLPQMPLPRRLHVGTRLTFHDDLRVGDALRRVNTFSALEQHPGRNGPMLLTTQTRRISTAHGLALVEEFDVMFLPAKARVDTPRPASPAPLPEPTWTRTLVPHPASLFRYAALTFNAHRIHFDTAYAREAGFPDLVVQGTFTAQCLMDLACDHLPRVRWSAFRFRAQSPLYAGQPVDLLARHEPEQFRVGLWAVDPQGRIAAEASMQYRPPDPRAPSRRP